MDDPQRLALSLLENHGSQLYRLLFKLTLRTEAAEDLLQELFVSLSKSQAWTKAKNPASYASRVAINLACNWRRRNAQFKVVPLVDERESSETRPLDALVGQEEFDRALEALADLSDLMRECLALRYLKGEPPETIAEQLGKTPHQVRALCSKGLAELRKKLGAESEE